MKTATTHTAGQWEISSIINVNDTSTERLIIHNTPQAGEPTAYICDLNGNADRPDVQANARLIAAAPELLEACKAAKALDLPMDEGRVILERLGWDYSSRFELPATKFVQSLLKAAIRKAEGNS